MPTANQDTTTTPQDRVWRAATELHDAGRPVTARAVRTRARIDSAAVQQHLQTWRAEQEADAADAAAAPPMPDAVQAALHRAWSAAYAEAEAALRPGLEAAEKRSTTLEAQVTQLVAEADAAEVELAEAAASLEAAWVAARSAEAAAAAAEAQAITEEKARKRAEARAGAAESALRDFLHTQAHPAEERGAAA